VRACARACARAPKPVAGALCHMDVVSAAGAVALQLYTPGGLTLCMPMPISTVCWAASYGRVALFCASDGTLVLLDTNADRALEVHALRVRPRVISVSNQTVALIDADHVLHLLRMHEDADAGALLRKGADWLLSDRSEALLGEPLPETLT
jgi:hypothetical protein